MLGSERQPAELLEVQYYLRIWEPLASQEQQPDFSWLLRKRQG